MVVIENTLVQNPHPSQVSRNVPMDERFVFLKHSDQQMHPSQQAVRLRVNKDEKLGEKRLWISNFEILTEPRPNQS